MSIDWEELLGASGEELQDAYERLCDDPWEDDSWDTIGTDEFNGGESFAPPDPRSTAQAVPDPSLSTNLRIRK